MHVTINHSSGETYRLDLDEAAAQSLYNMSIGDEIDGSPIQLDGYRLRVTGGSDKEGFPMRPGVPHTERRKLILSDGTGVNTSQKGLRLKKSVRGETVSSDIAQLNLKIVQEGNQSIEKALGLEQQGNEAEETGNSEEG